MTAEDLVEQITAIVRAHLERVHATGIWHTTSIDEIARLLGIDPYEGSRPSGKSDLPSSLPERKNQEQQQQNNSAPE